MILLKFENYISLNLKNLDKWINIKTDSRKIVIFKRSIIIIKQIASVQIASSKQTVPENGNLENLTNSLQIASLTLVVNPVKDNRTGENHMMKEGKIKDSYGNVTHDHRWKILYQSTSERFKSKNMS